MISDTSLTLPVINTPAAVRPDLWAQPRIGLASGRLVGYSLRTLQQLQIEMGQEAEPGCAPPMETMLHAACTLAESSGVAVGIAVSGRIHALPALVAAALRRAKLPPHRLELAIGPGVIEEAGPDCAETLSALLDLGIGVAMAGFNTQCLGLAHGLPLSRVVLAPDVLDEVPYSRAANASLHAIVNVARREGLQVAATGVESEMQRAILSGFGCDQGKGGLFGPPERLDLLLTRH